MRVLLIQQCLFKVLFRKGEGFRIHVRRREGRNRLERAYCDSTFFRDKVLQKVMEGDIAVGLWLK